jgi:transposase
VDTYHRGSGRREESILGKARHFSDEFKAEAVRLVHTSGQSVRRCALDLGIDNQTLGRWLQQARDRERPPVPALSADERAELVELRRRVKVLETEREILRKAAAFFASETERTR